MNQETTQTGEDFTPDDGTWVGRKMGKMAETPGFWLGGRRLLRGSQKQANSSANLRIWTGVEAVSSLSSSG